MWSHSTVTDCKSRVKMSSGRCRPLDAFRCVGDRGSVPREGTDTGERWRRGQEVDPLVGLLVDLGRRRQPGKRTASSTPHPPDVGSWGGPRRGRVARHSVERGVATVPLDSPRVPTGLPGASRPPTFPGLPEPYRPRRPETLYFPSATEREKHPRPH